MTPKPNALLKNLQRKPTSEKEASVINAATFYLRGQLLFDEDQGDGTRPLHHVEIELYKIKKMLPWKQAIASLTTDQEGYFFLPQAATNSEKICNRQFSFILIVFDFTYVYDQDGTPEKIKRPVYKVKGRACLQENGYDLGVYRIPFWNYEPSSVLPKTQKMDGERWPQYVSWGRKRALYQLIFMLRRFRYKHELLAKINNKKPSLIKIQKDYGDNHTIRLERECPGYTRSDAYFAERILNGTSAAILDRDPEQADKETYRLIHVWHTYLSSSAPYALPDIDVRFILKEEHLEPVRITMQGQLKTEGKSETVTCTPADGEQWEQAKRIARTVITTTSTIDAHLAQTHVNMEQYAIAFYRNVRKNPVRLLLAPHLKDVIFINRRAETQLISEKGVITRMMALTSSGITRRVQHVMGTLDWKNWAPQQPISRHHTVALVGQYFWTMLSDYIDDFFTRNTDEIKMYWCEIYRFSKDLIEHSVPLFLCPYLKKMLLGEHKNTSWFSPHERMDLGLDRVQKGGADVALSPITEHSKKPSEAGIEDLKQVCRYILFHTTFKHSWSNINQYDDTGELLYNGSGLRFGTQGLFAPESDRGIAPNSVAATGQLYLSRLLSESRYGTLLGNEDKDVPPGLRTRLLCCRQDFDKAWGKY
ncbi:MAG: lipoxygenase family protein [Proteobacteria bacterium]|nr:lipoxygenase family protein [Pseudomonadota bacterium]